MILLNKMHEKEEGGRKEEREKTIGDGEISSYAGRALGMATWME